ncbi:unnamed protein product [Ophioblennius macclurei]
MRLTALCVYGTLLAFSSPSWIMADSDEGALLDLDQGFGPCIATLRPKEPCRQGPDDSTCPYILSLPPLTVQLPQQLRELERIVQDLEKLKDSVDELREMCADCTASQSGRECASQTEHEKQKESEDERSWINERLQESDRDYRQEGGTNRGKMKNTEEHGDKSFTREEKETKNQEEEREHEKQLMKEIDVEKLDPKMTEKYGKTHEGGKNVKDKIEPTKVPNSGGDERIEDPDIETAADKHIRKIMTDRNPLHTSKEGFKEYQEDKVGKQKDRTIITRVKNEDKTEENEQYESKEKGKKTPTDVSDRIKMFEDHGEHTNGEQGEHMDKRREKEKGTNVEQNNEKPKQTESIGHTEKERTIKVEEVEEEEGRETGEEIKTEGEKTERAQGKSDGELSSSKPIERTDFVAFRPTPDSTISRASSPDSSDSTKAIIFTSSLPSPSLPSSTSGLITDVSHETIAASESTESTGQRAAGNSEPQNPDAKSDAATPSRSTVGGPRQRTTSSNDNFRPSSEEKPAAGFNDQTRSNTATTAPHENLYVTAAPKTRGHSHWLTPSGSKNISSNAKSDIRPLPGGGPKPGAKHKHETKSNAEQELKNTQNERRPEQTLPDKKTKTIPKQKPSLPKPTIHQSANNPRHVQITKHDQRRQPDVFSTDHNSKNTSRPKQDRERTPGQNKMPVEKPKPNQKSVTLIQRHNQKHPTVNRTHLDRYPSINQRGEPEEIRTSDENSKPDQKPFYPVKTIKSDGNRKPEMRPESEETRPDQSNVHEPELRRTEITILSPTPNQNAATDSIGKAKENPSLEPNSNEDSSSQKKSPDQRFRLNEETTSHNQKPVNESLKDVDGNPLFEPTSGKPLPPQQKITPDPTSTLPNQKQTPPQNNLLFGHKPVTESDKNPIFSSNEDSTQSGKIPPNEGNPRMVQQFKPTQIIPVINTESVTESTEKSKDSTLFESVSNPNLTPKQKFSPDRTGRFPDRKFVFTKKIPNKKPDQNVAPHQNIPIVHQEFESEATAKTEENPTLQPSSNKNTTPGEKIAPHPVDTHPNQKLNPGRKIPKFNQDPVTEMERSAENPSHYSKTNKDSTPGLTKTPEEADVMPNQRLKPNEEISTMNENPAIDSSEKLKKKPTFKPTFHGEPTPGQKIKNDHGNTGSDPRSEPNQKVKVANQKPRNEFIESVEGNSSFGSVSNPELTLGQKPDHAQTLPDKKLSTHQDIPTFDQQPLTESMERPDEDSSRDSSANKESTPGQKMMPDQTGMRLNEMSKPGKRITKPHQKTVTDSMKKPDQNPSVDPSSNENSTPGWTFDQGFTQPDQKSEPSQKIPPIIQKPATESKGMSENNPESVLNPDLTPGQEITPDQTGTLPDQKLTPNHNTLTIDQESVTESMTKSDGIPLPETTAEEDSTFDQKITPDQVNTWQDQKFKPDQDVHTRHRIPETDQMGKNERNSTFKPTSNQDSTPGRKVTPERVNSRLDQKIKPNMKNPKINQRPKPGQGLKPNQKLSKPVTDLKTKPNVSRKTDQAPQTNQQLKTPKPNLNSKTQPDEVSRAVSNKTSKHPPPSRLPIRPKVKPEATPVQRPKPVRLEPIAKTESSPDLPAVSWTTSDGIQTPPTGMPPASGPGKEIAEVSHSLKGTELNPSMRKVVTLGQNTAKSLENGPLPNLLHEDFTVSPNSKSMSNLKMQTTGQPPSTGSIKSRHGMLPSDDLNTDEGSTNPDLILKSDSSSQVSVLRNVEEPASTIPSPSSQITSTPSPNYRSTTSPTSGLKPSGAEPSTPSAHELRVKINQVAAFFNNSLSSNGRQPVRHPKLHPEDTQGGSRPDRTETPSRIPSKVSTVMRDCSDHLLRGVTESGVYLVTPDLRSRSFPVFCDMEREGGGWTVLQRRLDGSVSFNRSWAEYQSGFGELRGGEFWLGNSMIHLLTRERDMMLRVELQDFDGVEEYAEYALFRVGSERLRYKLTVGGYSGTAGDALRFNKQYDHNNRAFTTPDRDHDRYPSGNCGAYYSSGWWFDACMAANLNGRYYVGSYKGVRDGIFWGTWHNISTEYYPTNDRQSFKKVRMMIRPKGFAP